MEKLKILLITFVLIFIKGSISFYHKKTINYMPIAYYRNTIDVDKDLDYNAEFFLQESNEYSNYNHYNIPVDHVIDKNLNIGTNEQNGHKFRSENRKTSSRNSLSKKRNKKGNHKNLKKEASIFAPTIIFFKYSKKGIRHWNEDNEQHNTFLELDKQPYEESLEELTKKPNKKLNKKKKIIEELPDKRPSKKFSTAPTKAHLKKPIFKKPKGSIKESSKKPNNEPYEGPIKELILVSVKEEDGEDYIDLNEWLTNELEEGIDKELETDEQEEEENDEEEEEETDEKEEEENDEEEEEKSEEESSEEESSEEESSEEDSSEENGDEGNEQENNEDEGSEQTGGWIPNWFGRFPTINISNIFNPRALEVSDFQIFRHDEEVSDYLRSNNFNENSSHDYDDKKIIRHNTENHNSLKNVAKNEKLLDADNIKQSERHIPNKSYKPYQNKNFNPFKIGVIDWKTDFDMDQSESGNQILHIPDETDKVRFFEIELKVDYNKLDSQKKNLEIFNEAYNIRESPVRISLEDQEEMKNTARSMYICTNSEHTEKNELSNLETSKNTKHNFKEEIPIMSPISVDLIQLDSLTKQKEKMLNVSEMTTSLTSSQISIESPTIIDLEDKDIVLLEENSRDFSEIEKIASKTINEKNETKEIESIKLDCVETYNSQTALNNSTELEIIEVSTQNLLNIENYTTVLNGEMYNIGKQNLTKIEDEKHEFEANLFTEPSTEIFEKPTNPILDLRSLDFAEVSSSHNIENLENNINDIKNYIFDKSPVNLLLLQNTSNVNSVKEEEFPLPLTTEESNWSSELQTTTATTDSDLFINTDPNMAMALETNTDSEILNIIEESTILNTVDITEAYTTTMTPSIADTTENNNLNHSKSIIIKGRKGKTKFISPYDIFPTILENQIYDNKEFEEKTQEPNNDEWSEIGRNEIIKSKQNIVKENEEYDDKSISLKEDNRVSTENISITITTTEIIPKNFTTQESQSVLIDSTLTDFTENNIDSEIEFEKIEKSIDPFYIDLIPTLIENYRKGIISYEEELVLLKIFKDIWPLIIKEAARNKLEEMNPIIKKLLDKPKGRNVLDFSDFNYS